MLLVGIVAASMAGQKVGNDAQGYLINHPWPGLAVGMLGEAVVGFFGYRFLVRRRERREPLELQGPGALSELGKGLMTGAFFISLVMSVFWLSGNYRPQFSGLNTGVLVGLALGLGGGFLEETVFRGYLLRLIDEKYGAKIAVVIVSCVFGLVHLANGISSGDISLAGAFGIIICAGIFLSAAYYLTRRLWFVIGLHIAWNFVLGGVFGQIVSGVNPHGGLLKGSVSGPAWFSGGAFGPEASVVTMVVGLIFGAALLYLARERGNLQAAGAKQSVDRLSS